jgi:hypothetical protein
MWIDWDAAEIATVSSKPFLRWLPCNPQLVQARFPVGWHPSRGSRYGLIFGMRLRRKQLHTFDHPLLPVIVRPVLTRLKARYNRMPGRCRMLGCMLTRGAVTASDVPALRTPAEMKPPAIRRRQALHTPVTARFRSGINSALILLHFHFSFRRCRPGKKFKAPAGSSRYHPFLPMHELWPLH